MDKCFLTLTLAGLLCAVTHAAVAAEPSVDAGKNLFQDPNLAGSTNGNSCASCHEGGSGLEKAGARQDLTAMINTCIAGALNGKTLEEQSVEMQSLQLYIKSLGK